MICVCPSVGSVTWSPRAVCTGSSRATSPFVTAFASNSEVKSLLSEPTSKTVASETGVFEGTSAQPLTARYSGPPKMTPMAIPVEVLLAAPIGNGFQERSDGLRMVASCGRHHLWASTVRGVQGRDSIPALTLRTGMRRMETPYFTCQRVWIALTVCSTSSWPPSGPISVL